MNALIDIYENGFADGVNERTGKSTKRLPGVVIRVDVEKEFPILKSKQVFAKTALREILWIWQAQSNNIHDLKAHIWDEWADEEGSIGKAYGYQVAKPVEIYLDPIHKTPESFRHYKNGAEFILEYLRENPNGRWGNFTLWNTSELKDMNLVPCCHTVTWNLDGGRLNCVLDQRSGDMPYGVPFNTTQYAELMILFARDLGIKPGILTHVIADAHIYANQMDGVEEQIAYYHILKEFNNSDNDIINTFHKIDKARTVVSNRYGKAEEVSVYFDRAKAALESQPYLQIRENAPTSFFEITEDDIKIADYKNMGQIDFGDIAV